MFIYLFERQNNNVRSSAYWFASQVLQQPMLGQAEARSLGRNSGLPLCGSARALGCCVLECMLVLCRIGSAEAHPSTLVS